MSDTYKRKPKSPAWIVLGQQVLEGMADDFRSTKSNCETFNLTLGCIKTLLSGFPLSEKQSKLYIDNIRKRIPDKQNFVWNDIIVLTKKQRTDARHNQKLEAIMDMVEAQNSWSGRLHSIVDAVSKDFLSDPTLEPEQHRSFFNAFAEHMMSFKMPAESSDTGHFVPGSSDNIVTGK